MPFSRRIPGTRRDGDFLYLNKGYGEQKFHLHEIATLGFYANARWPDGRWTADKLPALKFPARRLCAAYTLKSGRRRFLYIPVLTRRKYGWPLQIPGREAQDV